MKRLIILSLVLIATISFSACTLWGQDNDTPQVSKDEGPSAVGPDSLPEMRGPLQPPTQ